MRYHVLLPILAVMAGCVPPGVGTGGSSKGTLTTAVGKGTAPYVLLDLQTHALSFERTLSDIATNANYRDRIMVFKRVGSGASQVLVGIFDVTQAQWQRIDPANLSALPPKYDPWDAHNIPTTVVSSAGVAGDHPAYGLDYGTIVPALAAFPVTGAYLAVPTAAQWETAAGVSSGWSWGSAGDPATLSANAAVQETMLSESNKGTRLDLAGNDIGGPDAVGQRAPNANGLYDIHGNVWQWTAPGTEIRGGSWHDPASLSRAEVHVGNNQGIASDVPHALIGVRLILVLQ